MLEGWMGIKADCGIRCIDRDDLTIVEDGVELTSLLIFQHKKRF